MVSTPIGSTTTSELKTTNIPIPPVPPPPPINSSVATTSMPILAQGISIYQQPCINYTTNNIYTPSTQGHTFPVLFNTPQITTQTDVQQPPSLYSEYIGNPYNNFTQQDNISDNASESVVSNQIDDTNMFQSSNYFSNTTKQVIIPPGSEMLFGEQNVNMFNTNLTEINNIPLISNQDLNNVN